MKQLKPVTEEKLQEILDTRFSDLNEKLDNIVGQLETIRDEQTIGFHQYKELEEKVDDHEKKIVTLESPHS